MTGWDATLVGGVVSIALILAGVVRDLVTVRRNGKAAARRQIGSDPPATGSDACAPCRATVQATSTAVGTLHGEAQIQTGLLRSIDKNIGILKDRDDVKHGTAATSGGGARL